MTHPRPRYDPAGILFAAATLLGWASVLLFLKYLTHYLHDAWTTNGWRYGISALLWLPVLITGTLRRNLPPGLWRRALVPSIINCASQVLFAWAPYYIDPGLNGFLLRVSLIFSTLGAFLLFADERPLMRIPRFWLGMILVAAGSAGTVLLGHTPLHGKSLTGILIGAASGALFGWYGVAVRYWMRGIPAMTSFAAICLYTAIGMVALMLWQGRDHGLEVLTLSPFNWFILVLSALVGIALGHVFFYASIARLGVAVTSATVQLAPFLCAAGSVVFFHETLTPSQWLSGGVLWLGTLLVLHAEHRRATASAASAMSASLDEFAAIPIPAIHSEGISSPPSRRDDSH